MTVTLTNAEAGIAAAGIEAYLELHRDTVRHHARMSALLDTSEATPIAHRTLSALEYVLKLLAGQPRDDAMRELEGKLGPVADALAEVRASGPVYPAAHQPTREELGGDTAVLRIVQELVDLAGVAEIASELGVTQTYAGRWLHDLEADELVRELRNGHGRITWELTPAGEAQL